MRDSPKPTSTNAIPKASRPIMLAPVSASEPEVCCGCGVVGPAACWGEGAPATCATVVEEFEIVDVVEEFDVVDVVEEFEVVDVVDVVDVVEVVGGTGTLMLVKA